MDVDLYNLVALNDALREARITKFSLTITADGVFARGEVETVGDAVAGYVTEHTTSTEIRGVGHDMRSAVSSLLMLAKLVRSKPSNV